MNIFIIANKYDVVNVVCVCLFQPLFVHGYLSSLSELLLPNGSNGKLVLYWYRPELTKLGLVWMFVILVMVVGSINIVTYRWWHAGLLYSIRHAMQIAHVTRSSYLSELCWL